MSEITVEDDWEKEMSDDPLIVRMSRAEFTDYYFQYRLNQFKVPAEPEGRAHEHGQISQDQQDAISGIGLRFTRMRAGTREEYLAVLAAYGLTPEQDATNFLLSMKVELRESDEVEHYRRPKWAWKRLMGREWFGIYRDGKQIAATLVAMS